MIGMALLARACGARVTSWNALALAALVVAFLWPAAVEQRVVCAVVFVRRGDRAVCRTDCARCCTRCRCTNACAKRWP